MHVTVTHLTIRDKFCPHPPLLTKLSIAQLFLMGKLSEVIRIRVQFCATQGMSWKKTNVFQNVKSLVFLKNLVPQTTLQQHSVNKEVSLCTIALCARPFLALAFKCQYQELMTFLLVITRLVLLAFRAMVLLVKHVLKTIFQIQARQLRVQVVILSIQACIKWRLHKPLALPVFGTYLSRQKCHVLLEPPTCTTFSACYNFLNCTAVTTMPSLKIICKIFAAEVMLVYPVNQVITRTSACA